MERDAGEKLLQIRLPVSDRYWHDYGGALALVLVGFLGLALLIGGLSADSLLATTLFVGLSATAVLTGLAVYNVVVVAVLLARR